MAHLVESEALVHHGRLSVDDCLRELFDYHVLANDGLHLLLYCLFLHFESIFVLSGYLSPISFGLLNKLRIELILQIVYNSVLSVLNLFCDALKLETLDLLISVLVL